MSCWLVAIFVIIVHEKVLNSGKLRNFHSIDILFNVFYAGNTDEHYSDDCHYHRHSLGCLGLGSGQFRANQLGWFPWLYRLFRLPTRWFKRITDYAVNLPERGVLGDDDYPGQCLATGMDHPWVCFNRACGVFDVHPGLPAVAIICSRYFYRRLRYFCR